MSDGGQNAASQRGNKKPSHLSFCPECSAGPGHQLYVDNFLPVLHISMQSSLAKTPATQVPQYTVNILHFHFIIPITIRIKWFCVTIYCLPFHHNVRCIRIRVISLLLIGISIWLSSISCRWKLFEYLLKGEYCWKKWMNNAYMYRGRC